MAHIHKIPYEAYDKAARAKRAAEFKLKLIAVISTTELSGDTMLTIADLLGMLPPVKESHRDE